MKDLTPPRYL